MVPNVEPNNHAKQANKPANTRVRFICAKVTSRYGEKDDQEITKKTHYQQGKRTRNIVKMQQDTRRCGTSIPARTSALNSALRAFAEQTTSTADGLQYICKRRTLRSDRNGMSLLLLLVAQRPKFRFHCSTTVLKVTDDALLCRTSISMPRVQINRLSSLSVRHWFPFFIACSTRQARFQSEVNHGEGSRAGTGDAK